MSGEPYPVPSPEDIRDAQNTARRLQDQATTDTGEPVELGETPAE